LGIETISVGGPDDTNWFEVFATDLVASQNPAGYWGDETSPWDNNFLNTCWALFVLEKIVPNKPPVAVCVDVEVFADENCEGHATVDDFDGGSYDPDDDPVTIVISPEGPYPLGETEVVLTITDDSGESASCNSTINVIDNTPPVPDIDPLPDVIGECEAIVDIPTATDNCAGIVEATTSDPLVYTEQGTYVVNWTYDDGNGNVVTQVQNVVVDDVTPPVITTLLQPIKLWPPNHNYVHFSVADFVTGVWDNCTDLTTGDLIIVKVTSDEPEDKNGNGDGKTLMDMVITDDCKSVDLRSEREGTDNGRVYTIHMKLDDGNGNVGTAICLVTVPHDVNDVAVDDGPVYEVTGGCNMEKSGIIADKPAVVEGYALSIYPNPFSRFANIQFTIPSDTKVLIKIYNIFGQEIETVLNQNHLSGTYILRYDATGLAPGNYMYRLITSDYSVTKKMILK